MQYNFEYITPTFFQTLWNMLFDNFIEKSRGHILHLNTGELIQLNEEEIILVDILANNLGAFRNEYQSLEARKLTFDCIAEAIYLNRKGNSEQFNLFQSWNDEQWISWVSSMIVKYRSPTIVSNQ